MRIRQMIIQNNLSKMKNKIFLTCLQGNYRDSLEEFGNMSVCLVLRGLRAVIYPTLECLLHLQLIVVFFTQYLFACAFKVMKGYFVRPG